MKKKIDWEEVFRICLDGRRYNRKSSEAEFRLLIGAYKSNPEKYDAMFDEIWNLTVPFGSNACKEIKVDWRTL